jgi:hypothetical protein
MITITELQQWLTDVYYRDRRQQVIEQWREFNLRNSDVEVVRQGIIEQITKPKLEYKETL